MLKPDEPKAVVFTTNPHFHCPYCWGDEWVMMDATKVCKKCLGTKPMVLCTPIVCASS